MNWLCLLLCLGMLSAGSSHAQSDLMAHQDLFSELDRDHDGQLRPTEVTSEHQRLMARLIRRGDANGDGVLNAKEFKQGLEPDSPVKPIEQAQGSYTRGANQTRWLLLNLDTDGDTRLTRKEAPPRLARAFDQLLSTADENQDGELDRRELSRRSPRVVRVAMQVTRRLEINVDQELRQMKSEQGGEIDRFDRTFDPRRAFGDPKQAGELFKQLDANRDGQLVVAELPEPAKDQLSRLVRRADRNRDGGLSREEFLRAAQFVARFIESTPKTESPPAPATNKAAAERSVSSSTSLARRLIERLVDRSDQNQDGMVSRNEARGQLRRQFSQADANGDGQLDSQELSALEQELGTRLEKANLKAANKSR